MSTDKTWQTESFSSDDTFAYGEQVGKRCRGGEIFVLSSDLGGGKTTFTKGLATGLGYQGTVSSPSFTVSHVYDCGNGHRLHHFDFYRLGEAGIVGQELQEATEEPGSIVVIEWADIVQNVLPQTAITITIDRVASSEDTRKITVSCPDELQYVMEGSAS